MRGSVAGKGGTTDVKGKEEIHAEGRVYRKVYPAWRQTQQ